MFYESVPSGSYLWLEFEMPTTCACPRHVACSALGRAGPYPADVLAALPGREGLRAHDHAAPHQGALPRAQPAALFGPNRQASVLGLLCVCLLINLQRKAFVRSSHTWTHLCPVLLRTKERPDLTPETHLALGPLRREGPCDS